MRDRVCGVCAAAVILASVVITIVYSGIVTIVYSVVVTIRRFRSGVLRIR